MKAKKPKRRYYCAEDIEKEIELYRHKVTCLMQRADALDIAAKTMLQIDNMVEDGKFKASQAAKCRRAALRILDKKLPMLKQKLGELMTEPIPGFLPDRSVNA